MFEINFSLEPALLKKDSETWKILQAIFDDDSQHNVEHKAWKAKCVFYFPILKNLGIENVADGKVIFSCTLIRSARKKFIEQTDNYQSKFKYSIFDRTKPFAKGNPEKKTKLYKVLAEYTLPELIHPIKYQRVIKEQMLDLDAANPSNKEASLGKEASYLHTREPVIFTDKDGLFPAKLSFQTMRKITGPDLEEYLRAPAWSGAANADNLKLILCYKIIKAYCEQLHQKNNLFRDIKPANLMFEFSAKIDSTLEIIFIDFEEAIKIGDAQTTAWRATPGYIAPELQNGHTKIASLQTDIYALGCLLREILSENFSNIHNNNAVTALINKMLDKEPAKRPPIDKLLKAFTNLVEPVHLSQPEQALALANTNRCTI